MNITVNINQLKRQLNIEEDFVDDDAILQHFLDVAEQSVNVYCGVTGLTEYTELSIPISINQAVILLAAHFYLNRNMVSYSQGTEIPYGFRFLLDPYRDFIVG